MAVVTASIAAHGEWTAQAHRTAKQAQQIVFVADDLGLSADANRGIARAAAAGLIREASLCVNGPLAREGARIGRDHGLGIGLHLCLTAGQSLSGPIRGLTDARGRFHALARGLGASLCGAVDRDAVRREVEAQLDRIAELGWEPTHVNGHHHVHCWPVVRTVCFAAIRARGVRWTRLPDEVASRKRLLMSRLFLASLARASRRHVAAAGLASLPFVGGTLQNCPDHSEHFLATLRDLPSGPCEWMVHPRDLEVVQRSQRNASGELATLTEPLVRASLRERGFEPACFADISADSQGASMPRGRAELA